MDPTSDELTRRCAAVTACWVHDQGQLIEWIDTWEWIYLVRTTRTPQEAEVLLRWMTPVVGPLPAVLMGAYAAFLDALVADSKARPLGKEWASLHWARKGLIRAREQARPELEALHAIEHPGCPWGLGQMAGGDGDDGSDKR